jgi:cell shape-determining protein MreC
MKLRIAIVLAVSGIIVFIIVFGGSLRNACRDFISPFLFSSPAPKTIDGQGLEGFQLGDSKHVFASLRKENAELREFLKIGKMRDYRIEIAQTIIRDPKNWKKRLVIDKGKDRGLEVGMFVLSANAGSNIETKYSVSGRILSVSEHSSEIGTIFDDFFSMSVMIGEEGIPAALRGGDLPALVYFDSSLIKGGEFTVFSSPYSEFSAPYIPIGTTIMEEGSDLFKLIDRLPFKPWAEIQDIRFVIIVAPKAGAAGSTKEKEKKF